MTLLRADLDLAQTTVKDLRAEFTQAKERLAAEEMSSLRTREKLSEEKARVAALEDELLHGRDQLSQLHVKIADGGNGIRDAPEEAGGGPSRRRSR